MTFRVDKVLDGEPAWDLYGAKTNGFPVLVVLLLLYTLLVLGTKVIGKYKRIPKEGLEAHQVKSESTSVMQVGEELVVQSKNRNETF